MFATSGFIPELDLRPLEDDAQVMVDKRSPEDVAQDWLTEQSLID